MKSDTKIRVGQVWEVSSGPDDLYPWYFVVVTKIGYNYVIVPINNPRLTKLEVSSWWFTDNVATELFIDVD